ncbi:winged helix-turn-helix transcriptional regulator [Leptospira ilyithenensis]|uniref:Transcriptional regulator n=1 Tax=Leptospira ilyithenensis TaxID=2484901 RepID=A0A4R9LU08_9LEPT|nr:helix-turn-helix domain-containing protein [Leptospira ilyithenensis]TGN10899.1 transcriptional regulator [Leptospira ilyithenensis]
MKRKSFGNMQCPVARSLELVGEWWSILILRDAMHGLTRFDEFEKSLEIAPNMLARRLTALVSSGLLERKQYQSNPPRYEYILTKKGKDFRPVLVALLAWGNQYLAPEGKAVLLVDSDSDAVIEPILIDKHTKKPLTRISSRFVPGPVANHDTIARINFANDRKSKKAKRKLNGSSGNI